MLAPAGVIATVAAGVVVKFFGRASINDAKLLDDFWGLVEHILNTILFTLGGAVSLKESQELSNLLACNIVPTLTVLRLLKQVWGSVIANGESRGVFAARDWGYMLLLYVFLTLIRFFLFFLAYPITSRIGLKTNLKETLFQVYGGLRGAVGIALAIALDSSVRRVADPDSEYLDDTSKVFGMIGGIAFCTLMINGTTAGPLLIKLGLADSSETRKKIVAAYEAGFKRHMINQLVTLLSQYRFRNVNYGLVKAHVPYVQGLTKTQLIEAVERHRDTTPAEDYEPPYLHGVMPYLEDDPPEEDEVNKKGNVNGMPTVKSTEDLLSELAAEAQKAEREKRTKNRQKRRRRKSNIQYLMSGEPLSAQEMRVLFISLLKSMYEKQIDHGELVDREFLAIALQQSLEFALDNVANGGILQGKPKQRGVVNKDK